MMEENDRTDWLMNGLSALPYIAVISLVVIAFLAFWPSVEQSAHKIEVAGIEREIRGYDLILDFDNQKIVRVYNDNAKTFVAELEGQGFVIIETRHFEPWIGGQVEYTDIELTREVNRA